MCGILIALIPPETLEREQEWAKQQSHPWDWEMMAPFPHTASFHVIQQTFPLEIFRAIGTRPSSAEWRRAFDTVQQWWEIHGKPWWVGNNYLQEWWYQLGCIPYGRIGMYHGIAWKQHRPRKQLFPTRLHPVGTTQWGQTTTQQEHLAEPLFIIETGIPPIDPCICCVGDSPETPFQVSVWFAVLDGVYQAWTYAQQLNSGILIEIDTDFNEGF